MSGPILADAPAFLRELVMRLQRSTLSRLKRVDPAALYWQPDHEANSIGSRSGTTRAGSTSSAR